MKVSRMLVVLMAVLILGLAQTGSAQAAQKSATNQVSWRASNVINGFSITFAQLLKYWKTGTRYWFD